MAYLSKELATINLEVPLSATIESLKYNKAPDFRTVEAMLKDFGFKTMLAKLHAEEKIFLGATGSDQLPLLETTPSIVEEEPTGDIQTIKSTEHTYITLNTVAEI